MLTFDFVLGLLSPPLELFAVVVEPLEAHDAVLEAGAARTRGDMRGHPALQDTWLGGIWVGTPLSACSPHAQRMLQARGGSGEAQPKAGKWGVSLPSTAIPHSISLSLFQLPESTWIQTILTLGGWRGKGGPAQWGLLQAEGLTPAGDPGRPMGQGGQWNPMAGLDPGAGAMAGMAQAFSHWAAGRQQWSTRQDEPEVLPMICFTARGRPGPLQ